MVIAADKGYETLSRLGVHPGLVVGDFDSLGSVPDHPQVLRLPRIKDETDTGFALRQGLKRGYRRFVLLGCLGGRLDHTVANLQLLSWLSAQGAQGVLLGEGEAAAVVTEGTLSFPASMEGFVSVFCAGGTARGVTLEGLKYPLDHAELTSDFPLGVSNEFVGLPPGSPWRRAPFWWPGRTGGPWMTCFPPCGATEKEQFAMKYYFVIREELPHA